MRYGRKLLRIVAGVALFAAFAGVVIHLAPEKDRQQLAARFKWLTAKSDTKETKPATSPAIAPPPPFAAAATMTPAPAHSSSTERKSHTK
jgi:hypothetical protein